MRRSKLKSLCGWIVPAIALLSAGCGADSTSQQSAATAPSAAKPSATKPAPKSDPLAMMAHAVVLSKSDAEVELTYDIQGKPKPGEAVDVKLLFMPTTDADALNADIAVAQPLSAAGQLKPNFTNVKVGEMNEHHFTVNAPAHAGAGIYLANVSVSLVRSGMTTTKSFAIPLVVGQVDPSSPAASPGSHSGTGG